MRIISIIILNLFCFVIYGQTTICSLELKKDTFDIDNYRVYIDAPEVSIKSSVSFVVRGHGTGIVYPIIDEKEKRINGLLTIESVGDTEYDMFTTTTYDEELWNTLGKDWVGSRCYVYEGKFYRIDSLHGFIIYYENLPKNAHKIADKIIDSIHVEKKTENSCRLQENKRRHQLFE